MQVKNQKSEPNMEQWTGSKLGKEYIKAVYCHPADLTYMQYIMWNARHDEAQAGIKIVQRNISNIRYVDVTTLMAESEEEMKEPLDESERGEWKSWLKTQHSKNKDHGIQSHHFMVNRWKTMETVTDFIFLGSKITSDGDCGHEIKRCLVLGSKAMTNLENVLKSRALLCQQKSI